MTALENIQEKLQKSKAQFLPTAEWVENDIL